MPELFSLVLPTAITAATSWATKRILEAVAGCPSCGKEEPKEIQNGSTSSLICSSCSSELGQYSIATDNTVRTNGRLVCANIFNPIWLPHNEGWLFKKHTGNWLLFDIYAVGMQHHGMVIEGSLRDMKTGKVYPAPNNYLNNDKERTNFLRQGWLWPGNAFPPSAIVADIKIKTTDGETLHSIAPLTNFHAAK